MSTIFANLSTTAITTTNSVKVALYKQSDPLAEVASQTLANTGGVVPETQWSFPGLDRTNYDCKVLEVDGSDNVLQLYNKFEFVPNENNTEWHDPILIKIGVTDIPGKTPTTVFPSGVNTVTVPDWVGWVIRPERIGSGQMKEGVDYSWDSVTGIWTLLVVGDVFVNDEFFFVTFDPRVNIGGGVNNADGVLFSQVKLVTNTTTLTTSDMGKMILVQGTVSYLEITLPDITTVTENKITPFEFSRGTLKCCRIKTYTGQTIDWLQGNRADLYGCPNESIQIYKRVNVDTTQNWRVFHSDGNFRNVGQQVSDDMNPSNVFNKVYLDGSAISSTDYARLYNDYVLRLPSSQVCNYSDHATGDNIYKWSFKDGTTGNFYVPDHRNIYERPTNGTDLPGTFQQDQIISHEHITNAWNGTSQPFGTDAAALTNAGAYNGTVTNNADLTSPPVDSSGATLTKMGTETRPISRITRKYVLS